MRILICDDDILTISQLSNYILDFFQKYHADAPEILTFTDGEALPQDNGNKDIVFLDIEMPGLNGIYVGQELKKGNVNTIIFVVTSFAEYLDEAMRFHVFRYLSKPLEQQRLFRNMKDAVRLYSSLTSAFPVETKNGIHTVLTSQIIIVEAVSRKVFIHTTQACYESIHTMEEWFKRLPTGSFFRSHRSYIVNFAYVTHFDHSTINLCHNQFRAYLTRRKYTAFKEAYFLYLESTR